MTIQSYTDNSFVLMGDTIVYKDILKKLGGKYNSRLKIGPRWIFPKDNLNQVESFIRTIDQKEIKPLLIPNYNKSSFVVTGFTGPIEEYKDKLKDLGGRYNSRLKVGPGYVFATEHFENVNTYIKSLNVQSLKSDDKSDKPLDETPPNISYPVASNYSNEYILYYRKLIHDTCAKEYLSGQNSFTNIPTTLFLNELFDLYNKYFFKNILLDRKTLQIIFKFSKGMTSTGGVCSKKGCNYTIKISVPVIIGTFKQDEEFHISNGIKCYDQLECMMNVFEHELIHLIVQLTVGHSRKGGNPIYKSHGVFFQQLARAYFGHTEFKHMLKHTVEKYHTKADFKHNDRVSYKGKDGIVHVGYIDRLNSKRARIKFPTEPGKYGLVPYPMLTHYNK
ncbi:MAG: SprT-like domain-containing protein [Nitrososphaeraceae archaeon]|nr:SprT-like domain-containing protein [Nitrososphaeraceae archaeon]